MIQIFKRWLSAGPADAAGNFKPVAVWAQARDASFRTVHDGAGFVVEGRLGPTAWRMEWGPSQRRYIQGRELRLRADLGAGAVDLQLLLINRPLQEAMEAAVFDQYVEGVQTRIDDQTPPEMRWLVMFPKLSGHDMGVLRQAFVGVASSKIWLAQWLAGPLSGALATHVAAGNDASHPMVLMIGRGRLTLRTQLDEPGEKTLEVCLKLFETALREAGRVADQAAAPLAPSTQPSLWSSSAMPSEEPVG